MKRLGLALFVAAAIPAVSFADSVGGCGWGSKLFAGQKGIAPQVLAVTTNGSTGNQTFGISSGTSGCQQDGVVLTQWKTAAYLDANMNKVALDMSRGGGESLASLASLMDVTAEDSVRFNQTVQANFASIFPSTDVTSTVVSQNLKSVLASDSVLAKYSSKI